VLSFETVVERENSWGDGVYGQNFGGKKGNVKRVKMFRSLLDDERKELFYYLSFEKEGGLPS